MLQIYMTQTGMNNNNPALPILIIIIITTTTTTTIIVIIIYIRVRKGFIPRTLGKRHLSYDRDRKGGGILLLWFWGGGGGLCFGRQRHIYILSIGIHHLISRSPRP